MHAKFVDSHFFYLTCRVDEIFGIFAFSKIRGFKDLRNVKLSVVDDACNECTLYLELNLVGFLFLYLTCRMENEWFFEFLF